MDKKLKEKTQELIANKMNTIFVEPINIDIDVPDYKDYISTPICFQDVLKKTEDRKYTRQQWYNDVCLIYQNAIDYHSQTGDKFKLVNLSQYLLWKFKQSHKYYSIKDEKEWMSKVVKKSNRIADLVSKIPLNTSRNSNVAEYIKKAESSTKGTPSSTDIYDLVQKANELSKEPELNEDILAILKESEGMTLEQATQAPVKFEDLKPTTQKAIHLYITSKNK